MNIENLQSEHSVFSDQAGVISDFVEQQLDALLGSVGVVVAVPIQYRLKSFESILEKATRKHLDLKSIHEFDDLIGIRLILLNQHDLELAIEVVESNFVVMENEDKLEALDTSQFGYRSVHYLADLTPEWLALPIFHDFENHKFEVQIRTLSQHVWADLSHKLQYKNEINVPNHISRAVYRVSALLETVDLEINRVFDMRGNYIQNEISSDNIINVDTLEYVLDETFPQLNKRSPEHYSELVDDLSFFQITNVQQLRAIFDQHAKTALESEENLSDGPGKPFFTHTGLASWAIKESLGDSWLKRRNETNERILRAPK